MNSRYTRKQRDTPPRSKSFLYATISIELVGIEEKCTPNHWVGIGREAVAFLQSSYIIDQDQS